MKRLFAGRRTFRRLNSARLGKNKNRKSRAIDAAAFALDPLESRVLLSADLAWTAGPALPAPIGNAAVLNNGGGIYVIGGAGAKGASSAVYFLDPNTGAWTSAPSIDQVRAGAGVGETGQPGPLVNGQYKYVTGIFVYGGANPSQSTASAFNYNPYNDEDASTPPSMLMARSQFAYATDPATGDLYAIGGIAANGTSLSSAEIYDPSTDAWTAIAPLPVALHGESAVYDGIGDILVFGGAKSNNTPVDTVYSYNIATGTWSDESTMPYAASGVSLVSAAYGQIYVIGGNTGSGATADVNVFNPITNQWDTENALPIAVYGAAAALDVNDNVVVIGGFNSAGVAQSAVYTSPAGPAPVGLPVDPTIDVYPGYTVYNGAPQPATAQAIASDGYTPVNGTFSFTYNGSATPPTLPGLYDVQTIFTSNDPNYLSTITNSTLSISQATPTLTVTGGGTFTYNGQPHSITATEVGIDGSTPVAGTITYTYNGSPTAPTTQGVYTAVATFTSVDPNYTNATATTTITIPDPTIPTGVKVTGASTSSITISWNPAPIPVASYNVYERFVSHSPRGSGATITYGLIASGITGTSITLGLKSGTFQVASVSPTGVVSPHSSDASGAALSAPDLYGATLNGALLSNFPVTVGQTIQVQLISTGNFAPTYSIVSGAPATMSLNPTTGLVTYTPGAGEVGTFSVTFAATNSVGSSQNTFQFTVVPAPTVTNFQVNDGNPQRSMVQSLTLTFNERVTLYYGAISLTQRDPNGGAAAPETYTLSNPSGDGMTYVLTFTDPSYAGGSLPDGVYDLTVNASLVRNNQGGTPAADQTFSFYRLYGDFLGTGIVNFQSLVTVVQDLGIDSSNPNYLNYVDINSDGVINFQELVGVIQNLGKSLSITPPSAPAAPAALAAAAPGQAPTTQTQVVVGINQIASQASAATAPTPENNSDAALLSSPASSLN